MEKTITKLPMNRSLQFATPLASDEECIVRTGIVKTDDTVDSFLHAVLSAYSREYFDLDDTDRCLFLKKFKRTLLSHPKPELTSLVKTALQEIYDFIDNYKTPDRVSITNKAAGKVICDIVSKDMSFFILMFKEVIPYKALKKLLSSNKETMTLSITEYLLEVEVLAKVERAKFNQIKSKLVSFIDTLYAKTLEYYTKPDIEYSLTNPEFMNVLTSKLNRNIYFIDSETKLPYTNEPSSETAIQHNKSIVVLKIDDSFEVIGKLYERNRIKRDLDDDEPFIENIIKSLKPVKETEEIIEKEVEQEVEI